MVSTKRILLAFLGLAWYCLPAYSCTVEVLERYGVGRADSALDKMEALARAVGDAPYNTRRGGLAQRLLRFVLTGEWAPPGEHPIYYGVGPGPSPVEEQNQVAQAAALAFFNLSRQGIQTILDSLASSTREPLLQAHQETVSTIGDGTREFMASGQSTSPYADSIRQASIWAPMAFSPISPQLQAALKEFSPLPPDRQPVLSRTMSQEMNCLILRINQFFQAILHLSKGHPSQPSAFTHSLDLTKWTRQHVVDRQLLGISGIDVMGRIYVHILLPQINFFRSLTSQDVKPENWPNHPTLFNVGNAGIQRDAFSTRDALIYGIPVLGFSATQSFQQAPSSLRTAQLVNPTQIPANLQHLEQILLEVIRSFPEAQDLLNGLPPVTAADFPPPITDVFALQRYALHLWRRIESYIINNLTYLYSFDHSMSIDRNPDMSNIHVLEPKGEPGLEWLESYCPSLLADDSQRPWDNPDNQLALLGHMDAFPTVENHWLDPYHLARCIKWVGILLKNIQLNVPDVRVGNYDTLERFLLGKEAFRQLSPHEQATYNLYTYHVEAGEFMRPSISTLIEGGRIVKPNDPEYPQKLQKAREVQEKVERLREQFNISQIPPEQKAEWERDYKQQWQQEYERILNAIMKSDRNRPEIQFAMLVYRALAFVPRNEQERDILRRALLQVVPRLEYWLQTRMGYSPAGGGPLTHHVTPISFWGLDVVSPSAAP